jgi:hypothetical protein
MFDVFLFAFLGIAIAAHAQLITDDNPLLVPPVGGYQLRVLSPTLLELTFVTTEPPGGKPASWNFVSAKGDVKLPDAKEFMVLADNSPVAAKPIGFRRRPIYAPLLKRDLRIGNYFYLQLAAPLRDGQKIEVKNPGSKLWPAADHFVVTTDSLRYSPAIHVNQTGYLPSFPKKAMIGYYLGSAGEMDVQSTNFELVDAQSNKKVFEGKLTPRRDSGLDYPAYQKVLEADFTDFKSPGEYRLQVPGLGASFSFFIDEGIAAAFARTYALGLYHQRCGTSNALPFTRFVHGPCHTAPAEIPNSSFADAEKFVAEASTDFKDNPRHTAPQLKSFETSLYPFVRHGKIDVSGGHHDAGDYSKYTINSAALVHTLIFAADVLPGVGALDNLGLPESGDGKSDILQEAKWETDFLAKMQDDDGGFYFLVYPRDRAYESDVLPDHGDPQIVWPKNTAATAAAVAALAQASSSPLFKKEFPEAAALYLDKAKKGWAFLERAIAKHGSDGAYQKLTHYGDDFMHDDELAWAACELFLATGDQKFHQKLLASFHPDDPATRRWGWWRLYESYGRAIRSYAFAAKTKRININQLDREFLNLCENEVDAAAQDQLRWSEQCAYGSSFPTETKRFRSGGWYFSLDQAFDLAAACALDQPAMRDPRPQYIEAILENLNYEAGCNPVNVCYLSGLGWKRERETVGQYAQNDRRVLPPTGIPIGNIQSGFGWTQTYGEELSGLVFPSDGAQQNPYPIYDRWSDAFNLQTEFVAVNQARALAATAFLMAQTSLTNQAWRASPATIQFSKSAPFTASLQTQLDLSRARIVWEAQNEEPAFGATRFFKNKPAWIEAEAQLPDGRRVFAVKNF